MRFLARRLMHGLLLLIGVSVFSFVLISLAPGNAFDELKLNPQVSLETVTALKTQYGLDRPLPVRYLLWLASIGKGDLGYSMSYQRTVGSLLWIRARNTLCLTVLATLLAWLVALPWGIFESLYRGRWASRIAALFTVLLLAIPDTLLALLLLLLAVKTGWFPAGGMTSPNQTGGVSHRLWDTAIHFVLPVAALALGTIPILVRHVRSAMTVALDSPFVEAARGHGISKWRIVYRHALPAAANPLIALLGFSIGGLLSMSLIVEAVLSWPGLGPLLLEAILSRDIYVVMGVVTISAVFLVLGNLIADILLYWNDPRVQVAQS